VQQEGEQDHGREQLGQILLAVAEVVLEVANMLKTCEDTQCDCKVGTRQSMKVRYREEVATHSDPESCVCHREVAGEALTGEIGGRAIEPRNPPFGMPTLLGETEGNTKHCVIASDVLIPRGHRPSARQEVLYTEAVRSQVCPVM
jgi:hypothetical protein